MNAAKKILIIAPVSLGYTKYIKEACNQYPNVDAEILYFSKTPEKFWSRTLQGNLFHRVQGFFLKLFFSGKEIQRIRESNRIMNLLSEPGNYDIIFIIRPDFLTDEGLNYIKSFTKKFIAYYWDSIRRFPRKAEIVDFFDLVYSFDRFDVEKYDLVFLTNYIFEESNHAQHDCLFFNICYYDPYRFPLLENLAQYLKEKSWTYSIQVKHKRMFRKQHTEVITTPKSVQEVSQLIQKAKILVDIQNKKQTGLSFRVFEALGHRKKLITTNKDIVNYDFYHPQNILVLDPEQIEIPEDFVFSPYVEIDEAVFAKYKIKNWVKEVFEL